MKKTALLLPTSNNPYERMCLEDLLFALTSHRDEFNVSIAESAFGVDYSKVDFVVVINAVRSELVSNIPDKIPVFTWKQDQVTFAKNAYMGPRDIFFGYIDGSSPLLDIAPKIPTPFPIAPWKEGKGPSTNSVLFMSNKGEFLLDLGLKIFRKLQEDGKLSPRLFLQRVMDFKSFATSGQYTRYIAPTAEDCLEFLFRHKAFRSEIESLSAEKQWAFKQVFLPWWLLEPVYRENMLRRFLERSTLNMNIYGQGWHDNPVLLEYADRLNIAKDSVYGAEARQIQQDHKYVLHLNHRQSYHQRIISALVSGKKVFTHTKQHVKNKRPFDIVKFLETQNRYFTHLFKHLLLGETDNAKDLKDKTFLYAWEIYEEVLDFTEYIMLDLQDLSAHRHTQDE